MIEACRHFGKLPTDAELLLFRAEARSTPNPATLRRHFGSRAGFSAALAQHVASDPGCLDVAAMLPETLPPSSPESEPAKPRGSSALAPDGFVYLIRSGEFYKIGRSDDIERRVREIRVALPDKAQLVHTIRTDDPPGIEAYWHQRSKDRRANGEWFKLAALDVSAFKKRKFQ